MDLNSATNDVLPHKGIVVVYGPIFHSLLSEDLPYTVKFEGTRTVGFRMLMIGSFRDPLLISQNDDFLVRVASDLAK